MQVSVERQRVRAQRHRARTLGMPSTLTIEQWTHTVLAFNELCAYCLSAPYTVLEHFIPVALAGTTHDNCVPACDKCNARKSAYTGDKLVARFDKNTIDRIQNYLISTSSVTPEHLAIYHPIRKAVTNQKENGKVYRMEDLFKRLTISISDLARRSQVSKVTVAKIRDGYAVEAQTTIKVLTTLSEIYSVPLTIDNVVGLSVLAGRYNN